MLTGCTENLQANTPKLEVHQHWNECLRDTDKHEEANPSICLSPGQKHTNTCMNVSGTWANTRKPILVICFSFGAWHAGVRGGEGSTNIVQEDKNVSFAGFYLCIHLGTRFLLFKRHHNSSHETHLPKKGSTWFHFPTDTSLCSPQKPIRVIFTSAPTPILYIYPIYGPVPEEQRCDVSHILGASAPSDKPPSVPLSAGGCTRGALVSDYSHFSTFRLPLKSIIPCNKPVLPNRLTQGEHIFSFPATMCNGSILCN